MTAMSAQASRSSSSSRPWACRAEPGRRLAARSRVRFATASSEMPRPAAAFSVWSPIRPAPTTRPRRSRRSPSAPAASASAIELAVAGFAPIAVSERARRPAEIAVRKSSERTGPAVSAATRLVVRVPDLAEDLGLAEHERVEPGRDAAEMAADVLALVDVQVVDEQLPVDAVPVGEHVDELLARALDPLGEVRVELDAVAGREHRVLVHRGAAPAAGPSVPSRSRSSTGAVRWLRPRQTRRSTRAKLYSRRLRVERRECARARARDRRRRDVHGRSARRRRAGGDGEGPDATTPGGVRSRGGRSGGCWRGR